MLPPRTGLGVVWFGQYALGAFGGFTVNIFLIPYTWFRHLAMAFWCAAWGLAGWAVVLTIFVKLSPGWHPAMDGSILISTLAGVVGFASILGEAALRRRSIFQSSWRVLLSTALTVGLAMLAYWFWTEVVNRMLFSDQAAIDAVDSTLVSLRYRICSGLEQPSVQCGDLSTACWSGGSPTISMLGGSGCSRGTATAGGYPLTPSRVDLKSASWVTSPADSISSSLLTTGWLRCTSRSQSTTTIGTQSVA